MELEVAAARCLVASVEHATAAARENATCPSSLRACSIRRVCIDTAESRDRGSMSTWRFMDLDRGGKEHGKSALADIELEHPTSSLSTSAPPRQRGRGE